MDVMFLCWTAEAVASTVRGTVIIEAARHMVAPTARAGSLRAVCQLGVPVDVMGVPRRSSDGHDCNHGLITLPIFGAAGVCSFKGSIRSVQNKRKKYGKQDQ